MLTIFFNSYFSWNISKSTVIEIARDAYKQKGNIENMSYRKKIDFEKDHHNTTIMPLYRKRTRDRG